MLHILMAGVNPDVWAAEIRDQLFPDNSIVHESKNDDMYATADLVKLPIAGANPDVLKNNTTYPLTPVRRTDTILEYPVETLETIPHIIAGLETLGLSYDKRRSIQAAHVQSLNTQSATYVIHKWSPTGTGAQILRTTGADRNAIVSGATGLRKLIELDSIIEASEILDSLDIEEDGRVVFFPAKMKNDLMRISDIRKRESFGIETLPSGIVTKIMGFKVMYRSQAAVYNNGATPTPVDMLAATAPTTANAAALFFHPNYVRKAFYAVQANVGQKDPLLSGGEAFNAIMKMGASPAFPDYKGVVALVEAHA